MLNENISSVHARRFRSTNALETMLASEDSLLFLEGTVSRCLNKGPINIQGGSNMTGTDLCVNKPHCAAAVRP